MTKKHFSAMAHYIGNVKNLYEAYVLLDGFVHINSRFDELFNERLFIKHINAVRAQNNYPLINK